jgi:hypothetical protein
MSFMEAQWTPIYRDSNKFGVSLCAQLGDSATADLNTAFNNELLTCPPATDAGLSHELLQAYFRHD